MKKTGEQLKRMVNDGYKVNEVTITSTVANRMGLFWGILFFIPVLILFINKFGNPFDQPSPWVEFFISTAVYLILMIVHEAIHGIFIYLFNGRDKSTIAFGINSGMPYCTCQAPINMWQYIIVLLMPTLILGIATSAFAIYHGGFWWLLLAFNMLFGGGGDFTIMAKILMKGGEGMIVVDHPYRCGFFALSKGYEIDESEKVFEEIENVDKEDAQRDESSQPSDGKKAPKKFVIVAIGATIVSFWVGWLVGAIFGYEDAMAEIEADNAISTEVTEQTNYE